MSTTITTKQLNFVRRLERKAGLHREELEKLTAEQAAQYIEQLLQLSGSKEEPDGLNGPQFGMICKIILQQGHWSHWLERPEVFADRVAQVYEMLDEARKRVGEGQ